MNENEMTIEQVLNITIGILNDITIPISAVETVGTPIMNAVSNIKLCVQAIEKNKEAGNNGSESDAE